MVKSIGVLGYLRSLTERVDERKPCPYCGAPKESVKVFHDVFGNDHCECIECGKLFYCD